ncbi:MAG: RNase H family protein [Bacteroidota bacterium]
MPWRKMLFRNDPVWINVDDDGRPVLDGTGRAEMKYRETDTKTYRPGPANLSPAPDGGGPTMPAAPALPPAGLAASKKTRGAPSGIRPDGQGAIQVWTDGACSGNPGPMGIGVVVIDDGEREEISEYLGVGTNNIAELVAIERGIEVATKRVHVTQRVRIHSDSAYSIGLLAKGWKAKANQELVARIRRKVAAFPAALEFIKVAGHAGVAENERCDELARLAVERRR